MHRVVSIQFKPQSARQWRIHGAVRGECAHLWNRLVRLHKRIRRSRWKWPSKKQIEQWAKGKFPGLHSQSVQQTIADFLDTVESARKARAENPDANYPWRSRFHYRDVVFTNQAVRIENNVAILPAGRIDGKRAYLRVPLNAPLPGRLVEAQLGFCELRLVCNIGDAADASATRLVAVDPGVNTLMAATDGETAVLVNGRGVKSHLRLRNKKLGDMASKQAAKTKSSRRWWKLQKAKKRLLAKSRRRIRDAAHKATRRIVDAFPNSRFVVGKAFNDAAAKLGRRSAQTVSQAVNGLIRRQLDYKSAGGAETIEEHYTSQTCPACLVRKKQSGRMYRCDACGLSAPRDVVGAVNIRSKAIHGQISANARCDFDAIGVTYVRPQRDQKRRDRSSSGGRPASCSKRPLQKVA